MTVRLSQRQWLLLTGAALLLLTVRLSAAPLSFVPQRLTQPDGNVFDCFASGDEYYNWLHDSCGYTIIQDPGSGYYVYAIPFKGGLQPSSSIAGRSDPTHLGIAPWLREAPEAIEAARRNFLASVPGPPVNAPTLGSFVNLAIFIRFADEQEFTSQYAAFDRMFNEDGAGSSSLYNYYREVSYGRISITTQLYPLPVSGTTVVSYQDSHPRAYYRPYNAATADSIGYQGGDNGLERTTREQTLLKAAVDSLAKEIPPGINFDSDGNGYVDNVVFIVRGGPTGWASLLWPHAWSLYTVNANINGKRVYRYNLQLETSVNVGVLCHEMYHSLGAPDLYHYTSSPVTPVGSWDLMANTPNPPTHMGSYMKFRYGGWITALPTTSAPGRYTLSPVTAQSGNVLKVLSPYSATEYFVLEYRKKIGAFERSLPAEGLLVYRINPLVAGNAQGPPDEVFIYRPGGSLTANGNLNNAPLSSDLGRTAINDQIDPTVFLTDGSPGGLTISDVGARGDTIGFTLGMPIPAVIDSFAGVAVRPDSIILTWVARAQYRNKRFELERSSSATSGFVGFPGNALEGSGTTSSPVRCRLLDQSNPGVRYYRIKEVDSLDAVTYSSAIAQVSIPTSMEELPSFRKGRALAQNFPNPFNPSTTIRFDLATGGVVELTVYDLLGREVARLVRERLAPGSYERQFDGSALPSGTYFFRLVSGGEVTTRRMILLR